MSQIETYNHSDGVVVLKLNEPERLNAMTVGMGQALRDALADLGERPVGELRAVILTGSGSAFSAGGDLSMLDDYAVRATRDGFDAASEMRRFYDLFLSVRRLPVPVVAAVNGHAIGAGACVALACDLVIVADEAKMGLNFVRIGIHPGMGASWLLPHLVGPQVAASLLYTGRLISGQEAAEYSLALESCPSERVFALASEYATQIAAAAPLAVRQLKLSLHGASDRTLDGQLDVEASNQAVNYATSDVAEGLSAVRERRSPQFTGE